MYNYLYKTKNMNIGIIAAEEDEMLAIKNIMENISEEKIYNLTFIKGKIAKRDCILVQCGVGKVNAARTTQILIDRFDLNYVINVGSAGSVVEDLNVKDIVIGKELVQYDFDISQIGNYEKGEICDVGKFFKSDENLIKLCETTIEELKDRDFNIKIGRIGSADIFCADTNRADIIRKEFDVECVEMEGAAIGQVCFLDGIPFLVIRGISDTSNGNNKIDFHTYLKIASKTAAEILKNLISKI